MPSSFPELPEEFHIERHQGGYEVRIPTLNPAQWALVLLSMSGSLKTTIETLVRHIADKEERVAVLMRLKQKLVNDIKTTHCQDDAMPPEDEANGMTAAILVVEGVFSGISDKSVP